MIFNSPSLNLNQYINPIKNEFKDLNHFYVYRVFRLQEVLVLLKMMILDVRAVFQINNNPDQ
jgi:hypothetical protein